MGKDRPGIVADVSEVIYECGGNIEDSSMSLLRNHFALLLLFSTEREEVNQKLSSALKRLEGEKNLTVFYSPITLEEAYPKSRKRPIGSKSPLQGWIMPGSSSGSAAFWLIVKSTSLIWRPIVCFLQRAGPLSLRWIWMLRYPDRYLNRG